MKEIYLDYASTTPARKEALKEALPYFSKKFGNPSSFHYKGLEAKKAMQKARKKIAEILNCEPEEIIFTGSGTESINLAIKGTAFKEMLKNKEEGKEPNAQGTFITQKTEHHAVLETMNWLKKLGFEAIELKVNAEGIVDLNELRKILGKQKDEGKKVLLVSIMYANNETGTIQPIKEISSICKEHKILFHSDACQAAGSLDINVKNLGLDMMTINGSKISAFKGTGLLYKKKEIKIEPLIHGGKHENHLRAGTENVPGIIALAKALELAEKEKKKENQKIKKLRDYLIKKIQKEIPKTILNGSKTQRNNNNANLSFEGIEGESIMLRLNEKGIFVSTGSACTSQSLEPSHVLLAMGLPHELAHASIRITLGKTTTKKELEHTIKELKKTVKFLRKISPEWKK
jgi:cysteine desulfurase